MRRMALCLALLIAGFCSLRLAGAQEEHKQAAEIPNVKTVHAYRVDFSINELQDGKKTNTRRYSMILTSGDRNQVKIGTRVPISTPETPLQYLDVGTNINGRIVDGSGDDLTLEVHADFSNLSGPEEQRSRQPIIRQITLSGTTVTTPGKPVIIGAADDPNSDRQFQLEATVTKLR